jgi:hypothetical protein
MPERLTFPLLILVSEIAERYVGGLLVDTVALYVARKNVSEVESWLQRQTLDEG